MSINPERLAGLFVSMCEIDSPSGREGRMADFLKRFFAEQFPEAELFEDKSAEETGSDCGNLVVHFPGTLPGDPVFFNCHMDTVEPGCGIKVLRDGDFFRSAGETILGGDDKAGIAILLEAALALKGGAIPHRPFDLLFTTGEEIGLRGAKAFDPSLLRARYGYALDSTGVDLLIVGAPAANRFTLTFTGAAAHAGLHPERGINAIQLAACCLADLPLGRLDEESTANVGLISGGQATNIVPDTVRVDGEVRSHSMEKLADYTRNILERAQAVVDQWTPAAPAVLADGCRPGLQVRCFNDYPALAVGMESPVVQLVRDAGERLGRSIRFERAGGGSDANIFHGKGLQTAIIGIGMDHVHSTDESIRLADMIRTLELVMEVIA